MNKFKSLKVWQKSVDLVIEIYRLTDKFPDKEKYGLVSQINRNAVSIAANIAEGAGRNSQKEFNNFLGIAMGSACELETHFVISQKLLFLSEKELENITCNIEEIQKMIYGLQKNLKLN